MSATLEHVRDFCAKHAPRISRFRLMVLLTIAGLFIWVLMGAKRGES
jgi:hypothetical protein